MIDFSENEGEQEKDYENLQFPLLRFIMSEPDLKSKTESYSHYQVVQSIMDDIFDAATNDLTPKSSSSSLECENSNNNQIRSVNTLLTELNDSFELREKLFLDCFSDSSR